MARCPSLIFTIRPEHSYTDLLSVIFHILHDILDVTLHCSYIVSMSELQFEWDKSKAVANLKKHGISFEEAKSVFVDERAKLIADPDHSEDEDRFLLLGYSSILRLLVICHCYRSDEGIIRIISARKASRHEAASYKR